MHPVVPFIAENVVQHRQLLAPLLFSIFATAGNVYNPVQHSLLVTAVSWVLVWIPIVVRVGLYSDCSRESRTAGWTAGILLGLSQICDRAACDKEGTWATKAFLPFLVLLLSHNELLLKHFPLLPHPLNGDLTTRTNTSAERASYSKSYGMLAVLTVSANAVLAIYVVPTTSALGISSAIFAATGLVSFDIAVRGVTNIDRVARGYASANGALSPQSNPNKAQRELPLATLRDVAAAVTIICAIASFIIEPSVTAFSASWQLGHTASSHNWTTSADRMVWMIIVNALVNVFTFIIVLQHGAVHISIFALFSCLSSKLQSSSSFPGVWFTVMYGSSATLFLLGSSSSTAAVDTRVVTRIKRVIIGAMVCSGVLLLLYPANWANTQHPPTSSSTPLVIPLASPFAPVSLDLSKGHPAAQLIDAAETSFQNVLNRQSKSLAGAVREYRRRNHIAPPPHFDKWFEFATRNGVVMVDEFDMINDMLFPFWALRPITIRSRVARALGHESSALVAVAIRDGTIVKVENGEQWQQDATKQMMQQFVQYLPDMDLGFNIHDEPRVVVPNDLLSAMITKVRKEVMPRVATNSMPRNTFSSRPEDLNDGKRFEEEGTTRFNRFTHQQTWTHSRLSCLPDTQAQIFEDHAADNLTAYAASPLGYIYNSTAFSDICQSPSLSSTFGFFERPNAFNVIHELTPVFSQSKISSFQDILYPSPWYWAGKVSYDASEDTTWNNKTNSLYWRGSTTGGFSRNGGWRRQHRQHIVRRINAPDKAQVLITVGDQSNPNAGSTTYAVRDIPRNSLGHLIDVRFSHVGQCDPGDCAAQKEFFKVTDHVEAQNAWYFKHLLDMDGNAFSGRFYSFLKSNSLTYKMAIFREWHSDWLQPWVHYIPLSLRGDEHLDLVRWFSGDQTTEGVGNAEKEKVADKGGNGDTLGERKAREIAQRSSQWHDKVLRKVDFEVWFFRLLLEYGRLIDDKREEIGYPGP